MENTGGAVKVEDFFELNYEAAARQVDIAILAEGVQLATFGVPLNGVQPSVVESKAAEASLGRGVTAKADVLLYIDTFEEEDYDSGDKKL